MLKLRCLFSKLLMKRIFKLTFNINAGKKFFLINLN